MAVRDPDTGQFVSVEEAGGFDNLDRQGFRAALNLASGDPDIVQGNLAIIEPAGGLERGEIAELVAMYVNLLFEADTSGASRRADSTLEVTRRAEPQLVIDNASGFESSGEIDGQAVDFTLEDSYPGLVYLREMLAQSPVNDTTNGVGAGADMDRHEQLVNYRKEAGRGPVFDRDDLLNHFLRIDHTGGADFQIGVHYWWAVFDEDDL